MQYGVIEGVTVSSLGVRLVALFSWFRILEARFYPPTLLAARLPVGPQASSREKWEWREAK